MKTSCTLRFVFLTLLTQIAIHAKAVVPNDSVDSYTNHTITDSVYVQGRSTLTISDVCVSNTGNLVASSPKGIVVSSGMNVELGGKLSLYERSFKCFHLSYDASGNIIRRKENWEAR